MSSPTTCTQNIIGHDHCDLAGSSASQLRYNNIPTVGKNIIAAGEDWITASTEHLAAGAGAADWELRPSPER